MNGLYMNTIIKYIILLPVILFNIGCSNIEFSSESMYYLLSPLFPVYPLLPIPEDKQYNLLSIHIKEFNTNYSNDNLFFNKKSKFKLEEANKVLISNTVIMKNATYYSGAYNYARLSYRYNNDVIYINIIFMNAPIIECNITSYDSAFIHILGSDNCNIDNIKSCGPYPGHVVIYINYVKKSLYDFIDKVYFIRDNKKIYPLYTSSGVTSDTDYNTIINNFDITNSYKYIGPDTKLYKFYFDIFCGDLENAIFVLDGIHIDNIKLDPVQLQINYENSNISILSEYITKK
jgi:hypothetical protein